MIALGYPGGCMTKVGIRRGSLKASTPWLLFLRAAVWLAIAFGTLAPAVAQAPQTPADLAERARKANAVTHTFSDRYKHELTTAMKDGALAAVGAYATFVPEIASSISEESPFEISRTAIRVRNSDNAADTWELQALERFAKDIAGGADPKKLEVYDVTTTKEGQRLFRYMRPIMISEQCMACHGPDVKGDVKAEIAKIYPDDKALGYAIGEMRGAFSLIQQLD